MITLDLNLTVEEFIDVKYVFKYRIDELKLRYLAMEDNVGARRVIRNEINTLESFLRALENCKEIELV